MEAKVNVELDRLLEHIDKRINDAGEICFDPARAINITIGSVIVNVLMGQRCGQQTRRQILSDATSLQLRL